MSNYDNKHFKAGIYYNYKRRLTLQECFYKLNTVCNSDYRLVVSVNPGARNFILIANF